jgi:Ser/Thr protein kinase RdoA (MazF antagonist)
MKNIRKEEGNLNAHRNYRRNDIRTNHSGFHNFRPLRRENIMLQADLFLSAQDKFWLWCKDRKLFNSIDISKYAVQNYYLRASRTAREWCEGEHPRLRRLDTQEKIMCGLWDAKQANIAWYKLVEK